MLVRYSYVDDAEIDAAVKEAVAKLGPEALPVFGNEYRP